MTTHNWEIRPAKAADLAEVILLERENVTAPHWSAADYAALLRPERGVRRCLYIASEGLELGGFAVGSAAGTRPDAEAELETVVVRKRLRRQGLGSALCRAVMEWSHREGAAVISLEVRAASPWALRLYGGLGFVATGRRPGYYRNPTDDAVIMRCALAGGRVSGPVDRGEAVLF
jgi:ribosomal-protein-alanine N-acetyltransferase